MEIKELDDKLEKIKQDLKNLGKVEVYTLHSQRVHDNYSTEFFAYTEEDAREKFKRMVDGQFDTLTSNEYVKIWLDEMRFDYKGEWQVYIEKEEVEFVLAVTTN